MKLKILILLFVILLYLPTIYSLEVNIDVISAMTVGEDITSPMGRWEKFLNWIEIIGMTIGFWVLVVLFFLLFTLVWWLPLQIYPIIAKHRELLNKFIHLQWKP